MPAKLLPLPNYLFYCRHYKPYQLTPQQQVNKTLVAVRVAIQPVHAATGLQCDASLALLLERLSPRPDRLYHQTNKKKEKHPRRVVDTMKQEQGDRDRTPTKRGELQNNQFPTTNNDHAARHKTGQHADGHTPQTDTATGNRHTRDTK